jgi:hypothetical protein
MDCRRWLAERARFATSGSDANSESATTDRIAHSGLAQVHSERPKINRFAVVEAHGKGVLSFKEWVSFWKQENFQDSAKIEMSVVW